MNNTMVNLAPSQQIDYKWVAIGDMFRPSELQRPMDEAHVARIAENWSDAAFGTPILSYREHGARGPRGETFAIVSGQHRVAAANKVGKARIYCAVVYGLSSGDEARLFIDEDRRKRQSALGKFHLARTAGDAEAIAIWESAMRAGFAIAKTDGDKSHRSIRCIKALIGARRRGNLDHTLDVLARAFDYDSLSATAQIVEGISILLANRRDIDRDRLASRMRNVGATAIIQRFRAGLTTTTNVTGGLTMANTLIGVYNWKMQAANALNFISLSETKVLTPEGSERGRATVVRNRRLAAGRRDTTN